MKRGRLAAGLLALLAAPTTISGQADPVEVVAPEPIVEIGDVLGVSPEYAFTEISSIAVVGDSILVLDTAANEVRIFDHDGRFLGRIGREGEGPGEFIWPTELLLVPNGMTVVDLRLRRQSYFALDGELLRTEPLGQLPTQALAGSAVMRGGFVVAETEVSIGSETGAFPERLIVLIDPRSERVDTLARYSTGYVPYRLPDGFGFLEVRTGSEGDWAVAGDSLVAVVSGEPPTLRWWRPGPDGLTPAGELALPIRPEPFTRDDAREILERENERRSEAGGDPLPRSVEIDTPRYWGQVRGLVISDEGECWIQRDEPRAEEYGQWFRIDLESRRFERATLPTGFRLLAASGGRLYGYMLTELDTPLLRVYRLLDAPS